MVRTWKGNGWYVSLIGTTVKLELPNETSAPLYLAPVEALGLANALYQAPWAIIEEERKHVSVAQHDDVQTGTGDEAIKS